MTPSEIYDKIRQYTEGCETIICNLHSACSPTKGKIYMCTSQGSKTPVIDFDTVKTEADKVLNIESRNSVDGLTKSPSGNYLCFVELKSWDLVLSYNGTEKAIRKQAKKYESNLPLKLTDSISICKQICKDNLALDNCRIIFILLSDISVEEDGQSDINSNLTALAGSSSNLNMLCNQLSTDIMNGIPNVETRYWECREFDGKLRVL